MLAFCAARGIVMQAYSPLGTPGSAGGWCPADMPLLLRVPVSDWALDARVYGLFAHTHAFEAWRGDPCALRLRMRRWLHHDLVPLARRTRLFVRRLRFVPTAANVWWRTHLEPWLRDGMPLSDCLCVPILPMDFVRLGRHLWRAKWQQNNALAVSHTADI
jgi:hypothetical protein